MITNRAHTNFKATFALPVSAPLYDGNDPFHRLMVVFSVRECNLSVRCGFHSESESDIHEMFNVGILMTYENGESRAFLVSFKSISVMRVRGILMVLVAMLQSAGGLSVPVVLALIIALFSLEKAAAQVNNGNFSGGASGWTTTAPANSSLSYAGNQLTVVSDNDGGANSRTYASQSLTNTDPGFLTWLLRSYTSVDTDLGPYDYPMVLLGTTFYYVNTAGGIQTTNTGTAVDNDNTGITNLTARTTLTAGTRIIGAGVTAQDSCCGAGTAIWDDIVFQELTQSPGAQTVASGAVLTFSGASAPQVATNSGATSMTVTLSVTNGVLNLGSTAGLTSVSGNNTASITFSGSPANINSAMNNLTYTPTALYSGSSTLTFFANGGGISDTDTIPITVTPTTLTLVKTVATGGALDTAWTLQFSGGTAPFFAAGTEGSVNITSRAVTPGNYSLAENSGPSGYSLTGLSCTGAAFGTTSVASPNITVAAGENVVCTFTNTANALLTLQKTVNGGTALDTAWTLQFGGSSSGNGTEGAAAITNVAVSPGTFSLQEYGGPSGYRLQNLSCVGAANTSTTIANPNVTIANGQNVTCTFTNGQGRLTLVKSINGGASVPAHWTMSMQDANGTYNQGITGAAAVTNQVVAAGNVVLNEFNTGGSGTGYTLSAINCSGSDTNGLDGVVIQGGENVTCTLVNNFSTPSFTINKVSNTANVSAAGTTITYTVTVDNTGTVALTAPVFSDTLTQNGAGRTLTSGPTLSGDANTNNILEPSETWVYTSTYLVTQADIDDGNNLVNVASFASAQIGASTSSSTTTVTTNPSLTLVKSSSAPGFTTDNILEAPAGTVVTYTYTVTNNGNQTIGNVEIDDSGHTGLGPWVDPTHAGSAIDNGLPGGSADTNADPTVWGELGPLDVIVFSTTYTITQADIDAQ